jgi:WhiB family redox-sensing transcriptional regulator
MTAPIFDWRERAACLGEDPELFFPVGTGARAAGQIEEAKVICGNCPVAQRCADFAVANGYEGVWGGLDDEQRRRMRRGRLVRACRQEA